MLLQPCLNCARHIQVGDACPFCQHKTVRGLLIAGALLAGAIGCSTPEPMLAQPYGIAPPPPPPPIEKVKDAGVDAGVDAKAPKAVPMEQAPPPQVSIYGEPPMPRLLPDLKKPTAPKTLDK